MTTTPLDKSWIRAWKAICCTNMHNFYMNWCGWLDECNKEVKISEKVRNNKEYRPLYSTLPSQPLLPVWTCRRVVRPSEVRRESWELVAGRPCSRYQSRTRRKAGRRRIARSPNRGTRTDVDTRGPRPRPPGTLPCRYLKTTRRNNSLSRKSWTTKLILKPRKGNVGQK